MKWDRALIVFGVAGLFAGCGGETSTSTNETGNTNWLKECSTDLDCGTLSCYCGSCRETCGGVVDCSSSPEQACAPHSSPEDEPLEDVSASPLLTDDDADITDVTRGPGSSIYVTGGKGKYQSDLSDTYSDFWLAQIDSAGELTWEVREPIDETDSMGISLAYSGSSGAEALTVLSTRYVDGDRTLVRYFDAEGNAVGSEQRAPEFEVTRSHPSSVSFLGGFEADRAVVVPLEAPGDEWPAEFRGVDGGRSSVTDMAVASDGSVAVVGHLGTDPTSNETVPWASGLDSNGSAMWEHAFPVSDRSHCEARGVALANGGVTLVAGECSGNWLKGIARDGSVRWERHFEERIGAIATSGSGYFVSTGTGTRGADALGTLLAFDEQHRLLWRVREAGCEAFHRLIPIDGAVVAVARCDDGIFVGLYRPSMDSEACACGEGPLPLECGCDDDRCIDTAAEARQAYRCMEVPSPPSIETGCGYLSISMSAGLSASTYHYDALTEQLVGFQATNDVAPTSCELGDIPDCPEAVRCTPCLEFATDELPYCD